MARHMFLAKHFFFLCRHELMRDGGKSQELGRDLSPPLPTCAASLPGPPAPEDSAQCQHANVWVEMALSILSEGPRLGSRLHGADVQCYLWTRLPRAAGAEVWSLELPPAQRDPWLVPSACRRPGCCSRGRPCGCGPEHPASSSLSPERQPLAFPAHLGSWRRQEITPSECGRGDSRITGRGVTPGFTAPVCLWLFSVPRACVSSVGGREGAALRPRPGPAGPEKWGRVDAGAHGSWPGGQSAPPAPQKLLGLRKVRNTRVGGFLPERTDAGASPTTSGCASGLLAGVCSCPQNSTFFCPSPGTEGSLTGGCEALNIKEEVRCPSG